MSIVNKPWGWYKDLERSPSLVIKKLYIKPFSRFSLQKHFKRDEYWQIVSGYGKITLNSQQKTVGPGDSFKIAKGDVHRLEAYADGITFVEVQTGECFEKDIVRLEDDYNRVTDGL
tara:strand:+ start:1614 stop:1961 length:348 start_codon:yes stop_codon:yes gene_type:complete